MGRHAWRQAFDAKLRSRPRSRSCDRPARRSRRTVPGASTVLSVSVSSVKVGSAARDVQQVDELRPAAQVQVANLDHVPAVGRGRPVFQLRIGIDVPAGVQVVVLGQLLALLVQDAQHGIERRLLPAGHDLDAEGLSLLGLEGKAIDVPFRLDPAAHGRGRPRSAWAFSWRVVLRRASSTTRQAAGDQRRGIAGRLRPSAGSATSARRALRPAR